MIDDVTCICAFASFVTRDVFSLTHIAQHPLLLLYKYLVVKIESKSYIKIHMYLYSKGRIKESKACMIRKHSFFATCPTHDTDGEVRIKSILQKNSELNG